jgi:hypothetical protein
MRCIRVGKILTPWPITSFGPADCRAVDAVFTAWSWVLSRSAKALVGKGGPQACAPQVHRVW